MTKQEVILEQVAESPEAPEGMAGNGDKPMRWAVGPDGSAIHIFDIPKDKKGLKCECTCPGCRTPLQAVNVCLNDRSGASVIRSSRSGRTMSQFFRHPAGQARRSCMQKATQLAALTLFRTQAVIDVPAPKSVRLITGVSGRSYRGEVIGLPQRLTIRRTLWSDQQSAFLETATGERVLVILHSAYTGEVGPDCDGVITVQCDDPDIAGMAIEELLTKVALSDEHTCWEKHWSGDSLAEKALEEARAQAFEALDWIPPEMVQELGNLPLTSESLLHLVIKQIIAEAGYIVTPQFSEEIPYVAPGDTRSGFRRSKLVTRDSKRINLGNIRLEHWMPGMIPDIYCDVAHEKGSHELLIEVKVTHGIGDKKLELIRSRNLLCMEVDVALFSKHGRLTRTQLREEVLDNPDSKVWCNHPWITAQIADAQREISEIQGRAKKELEKARQAERLWQIEQDRLQEEADEYRISLANLTREDLEAKFAEAVQKLHRSYLQLEEAPAHINILTKALSEAGHMAARESFFTGPNGVIGIISQVINAAESGQAMPETLLADLQAMSEPLARDAEYLPLALWSIKRYPMRLTAAQAKKLETLKWKVWTSIQEGKRTYARTDRRDALIGVLFPALKADLLKQEGTIKFAETRENELRAKAIEDRKARDRALYLSTLDQSDPLVWTDTIPSPAEYSRLLRETGAHYRLLQLGVVTESRRADVMGMAYQEAKQGGSVRTWLVWVEEVKTKADLVNLVTLLLELQLVDAPLASLWRTSSISLKQT